MKNVLVTGADGFIGSHVVELLVCEGYRVRALTQYNSFNSWGWLEDSSQLKEIEVISGDVRDPFLCERAMEKMDAVLNLAALIAIPYSYAAPQSYIETNVSGALNICQAALKKGVSKVIQTSTSEVYGTACYVPIDEKHPLQPQSPYSASKIGADAIALSYFHSFELPVTVARPFNTYGPRQSARAVIPTIITQLASGMKEINLGDLTPTRDFNYVEDTARGFLAILKSDRVSGETINIGSGQEISIGDTFKKIQEIMMLDAKVLADSTRIRPAGSEVQRLLCDSTKLTELTGYRTAVSLDEGFRRTVDWFTKSENLRKYKAHLYNV